MQSLENKGKIKMTMQDDAASSVNVTGTDQKIDAPVTQPCSPSVLLVAKNWQSAYAKAHERVAPPVTWENGWFIIGNERRRRWALGERSVPEPVAILLRLMLAGKITADDIEEV